MPSKSTSSTESSDKPKRKTARKKPATTSKTAKPRKKAVRKKKVEDDDDLEFGAGIVEEDRSSAEEVARAESYSVDDIEFDDDDTDGDRPDEVVPEPRSASKNKSQASASSTTDADADADAGDTEQAASQSSEEGGSETEGDEKPRRRRRRRRRRGESSGSSQKSGDGGRSEGSRGGEGGGRGGRGRRSGGGGGSTSTGNQRGRRPTKFEKNAAPPEPIQTSGKIEGVLELHPKGYGFLRSATNDYGARESDPFVSSSFVEKHHLREGIKIVGEIGPGTRGQGPRLLEIESIDGGTVEEYESRSHFDNLTPINPFEQLRLETENGPVTMRVMDMLTPIGKGQRALLVAPPRSGKTMLMQDIANAVSINHPEVHLIVLLIDERPEEVTEMRRMVNGEVIASSMDENVESHVRISQLIFERGKRLAESGKDCLILMDSVTRTARAFNKWMSGGRESKIGTGGLDVRAMDIPRKMFGTARRFDEGGSLTVVATALIDTGSRMDEAIFQEFKGTGNMELVLSRDLADRRIWPAIDISKSGTRREEKILDPEVLDGVTMLRRSLVSMNPVEAMEQLIRTLAKFESNKEFLKKIRAVL